MLLVIDVGNTNITVGVFDKRKLHRLYPRKSFLRKKSFPLWWYVSLWGQ